MNIYIYIYYWTPQLCNGRTVVTSEAAKEEEAEESLVAPSCKLIAVATRKHDILQYITFAVSLA
jgi:hypothetical protein